MKLLFTVLIFVFSIITSFAQDPVVPHDTYFFLGIGLPIEKVKDEGHSPLRYQGWTPTLRLGYETINAQYMSRISVSASFGAAQPNTRPRPQHNLSSLEMSNIFINYTYYKRTGTYSTEGGNRYIGGAFTLTFDIRNYNLPSNNVMGYQANASLNFGGFFQDKISSKWRFNYEAFTPILSYSLRPNYLGMLPVKMSDFNAKSAFINGKIVTINKLFRFYNRFSFDQQINDHRQRRINYSWDYHWNAVSKPMKSVVAGIGYESLFKM